MPRGYVSRSHWVPMPDDICLAWIPGAHFPLAPDLIYFFAWNARMISSALLTTNCATPG